MCEGAGRVRVCSPNLPTIDPQRPAQYELANCGDQWRGPYSSLWRFLAFFRSAAMTGHRVLMKSLKDLSNFAAGSPVRPGTLSSRSITLSWLTTPPGNSIFCCLFDSMILRSSAVAPLSSAAANSGWPSTRRSSASSAQLRSDTFVSAQNRWKHCCVCSGALKEGIAIDGGECRLKKQGRVTLFGTNRDRCRLHRRSCVFLPKGLRTLHYTLDIKALLLWLHIIQVSRWTSGQGASLDTGLSRVRNPVSSLFA